MLKTWSISLALSLALTWPGLATADATELACQAGENPQATVRHHLDAEFSLHNL